MSKISIQQKERPMWDSIIKMLQKKYSKLEPQELQDLFLNDLRDALNEHYKNREREGVHVSDLNSCIRKQVYNKIDNVKPTDDEINYFVTGEAIHKVIEKVATSLRDKYIAEKDVKLLDLVEAHIDLFNEELKMPIEMKTARKDLRELLLFGPSSTYLIQLASYLAMTDQPRGLLYYNLLAQKKTDFHHGYILELSEDDREMMRKELMRLGRNFEKAMKELNPDIALAVHDVKGLNFMCYNCPYATSSRCKEGFVVREKASAEKEKAAQYGKRKIPVVS